MLFPPRITDTEVRQQVEQTDRFIAEFREMIAATAVDPASLCAEDQRRGLNRIAATVDHVDHVFFANLANLNAAMRGVLPDLIEVKLMCVGAGPTLDYLDAAGLLARFQPLIDMALRRRLQ